MAASLEISLRRAEPRDSDFAFQVLERSMRTYVEGTWGTWSEAQARIRTSADAVETPERLFMERTPTTLFEGSGR